MILRYKLESAYMQLCTLHQWPDCIVACRAICRLSDVKDFAHEYHLEICVNNAVPSDQFYLINSANMPKHERKKALKIV